MKTRTPIEKIIELTCEATGNTVEEIKSKNYPDYLSEARFIMARLARSEGYKLEDIATASNRNHSTVLYRLRQHEDKYGTDKYYQRIFKEADELLKDYIQGYITEVKEQEIDTKYGKRTATVTYRYHKCQ